MEFIGSAYFKCVSDYVDSLLGPVSTHDDSDHCKVWTNVNWGLCGGKVKAYCTNDLFVGLPNPYTLLELFVKFILLLGVATFFIQNGATWLKKWQQSKSKHNIWLCDS